MKTKKVLTILAALLFALSINAHASGAVDMLTGASAARSLAKQAADSVKKAAEYKQKAAEIEVKAAALSDKNRLIFFEELARLGVRGQGWLFADAPGISSFISSFAEGDSLSTYDAAVQALEALGLSVPASGGTSSGSSSRSASGMKWSSADVSSIFDTGGIDAIAYGNNKFVAGYVGTIAYSSNGATWTEIEGRKFPAILNAIAYGNNRFVAVGYYPNNGGGNTAYSDDGVTWTERGDRINYGLNAVAYGNNRWVVGGERGRMAYSTDNGVTWTAVADTSIWDHIGPNKKYSINSSTTRDGYTGDIYAIAYGGNKFVAVGENGKIAYSTDGVTWTAASDASIWQYDYMFGIILSANIKAVVYGGNRFIAGGDAGIIAYSSDGVRWTAVADSSDRDDINAIAFGNNRFVAGGYDGKIAYSTDGRTWTASADRPIGDGNIYAIAFGGNRFVVAGQAGRMAYSE